MLPQVQMHPLSMRSQSRHHHLHSPRSPASPSSNATYVPSSALSCPIRTLQHAGSLPTNNPSFTCLHGSEYRLRRKTPNGTIDAAYDASPLHHSEGPPPYKQVARTQAFAVPSFPTNASLTPFVHTTSAFEAAPVPQGNSLDEQTMPWSWNHPPGTSWVFNSEAHSQPQNHHPRLLDGASCHVVQPVIRANEYNVRAFCPPPLPSAALLPFGQLEWPVTQSQGDAWHRSPFEPLRSVTNPAPTASMFQSAAEVGHPAACPRLSQHSLLPNEMPYTPVFGTDSRLGLAAQAPNAGEFLARPGFRDKVLSQAHAHYLELLTHTQTSRKVVQSKSGQSARSVVNLFLYPKPPNPFRQCRVPSELTPIGAAYDPLCSNRNQPVFYVNSALANPSVTGQDTAFAGNISCSFAGGTSKPGLHWEFEPAKTIAPCHDNTPIEQASSSLHILTNMCEQSGWKWTEGMLLGGCLLYGLKRYTEALEWFSRIFALDPSHVESLTNAAATLYCLNRHQEAEQLWLQAVHTCPSYLEAAEHLVGLLYRKRSKDAIEVVTFVQDSLRTPQASNDQELSGGLPNVSVGSHADRHHVERSGASNAPRTVDRRYNLNTDGFGSSGYALPGRENGRLLALVHAKATMLYTIKDITAAAEAFEEAVLISVGRKMRDIRHLVRRIQAVLAPKHGPHDPQKTYSKSISQPLLLTPDRARQTARLVFSGTGELPGLAFIPNGSTRRAAIQTTSNSLLSVAKIFQDATSHGGNVPALLRCPPGIEDILALYYLSLSLQESPSTANNVGILLAGIQPEPSTAKAQTYEPSGYAAVPGVVPGSGLALALAYYQYGLRLDPKHVHLHTNLGSLLKDIGQLDLAIQMYEQAVSCDSTFDIALTNLANAVKDRGRIQDAIAYYKRAVQANPTFAEAVCGLFTALNSVCDWRGRGGVIMPNCTYDRWHVDTDGILVDACSQHHSSGLAQRVTDIVKNQLQEASRWGLQTLQDGALNQLVEQLHGLFDGDRKSFHNALRQWTGQPWEGSRIVRLIERACRIMQRQLYLKQYQSNPSEEHDPDRDRNPRQSLYRRPRLPANLTVPPAPTVLPFHTFTCPLTADDVRAISQRNAVRISCSTLKSTWLPDHIYPPPSPPDPQLNVGYVSSDFNNHPLAHLMQSVFGFHNPQRVKAYCYATTASDGSSHRLKIEKEAPVFRDVSTWSSNRLAGQISQDNIHVLVNLNGYTRGARNEIFAARPAPIQMSFMGFAGSLGAEWCDYLLADRIAVPETTLRPWRANTKLSDVLSDDSESSGGGWIYSENIIFCRDTFFCCDHAQSADETERNVTWAMEQERRWAMRKMLFPNLDDGTIILGNFNQLYKIEPTTFRTWLRILDKVPKAVLWLLRFPEPGEQHLRSTAKAWAGEEVANRLIFTDVAPKNQHISRARVCDLFLDTPECNAHTTAADVLWSSTPLLTLPRYPYKMCSRMAASILRGALPKNAEGDEAAGSLISLSEEAYESSAVLLAGGLKYDTSSGIGIGRGRLAGMRKLLWDSKWTCGLFDTRRWVADVEGAYEQAWERWVKGESGDIYL